MIKLKKHSLLISLILLTTVLYSTDKAFGYAEVEQAVNLSVQPAVAIQKTISIENGTINPRTGVHTGLNASFSVQTNGTDDDYDFIIGSNGTKTPNTEEQLRHKFTYENGVLELTDSNGNAYTKQ